MIYLFKTPNIVNSGDATGDFTCLEIRSMRCTGWVYPFQWRIYTEETWRYKAKEISVKNVI